MTLVNYEGMNIEKLRRYVLSHREDETAFQAYIDRSKEEGRMVSINPEDSDWEKKLDQKMPSQHHSQEQDYWGEEIDLENSAGRKQSLTSSLLRVYPENFNGYDAYLDILMNLLGRDIKQEDVKKVHSSRLKKTWEVVTGPIASPINGFFRGDYTENNPPVWTFGLKLL